MNRKSSLLNEHRHFSAFAGKPDGWRSFQQAVDLLEAGIKLKSNPALEPLFRQAFMAP